MLTFEEKVYFVFEDLCDSSNDMEYNDPFENRNTSDLSAKKELCSDDRNYVIEMYKALADYPDFKRVLTTSNISFDIALHYIEKKDYELLNIFLNLSDFEIIKDEGEHYLFSYLPPDLSNEDFIKYYNQFVIKKFDSDYSILSDFIATIIDNNTICLFKDKLSLLLENLPSEIVNKTVKKTIYDIFYSFHFYGIKNDEKNNFEELIVFLASKVEKIDIASLINIHITDEIEPDILINALIKKSEYMENANNYEDIFKKYNKSKKCIPQKFIDLLSVDFIELQKKKMIETPRSVIQSCDDIYLYTAIYMMATPDEKEAIKDGLKKSFTANLQLSIIMSFEQKNSEELIKHRKNKAYGEIQEMLTNIKKSKMNYSEINNELVEFIYNYIDMLSLKDNEVLGDEDVFKCMNEVWPELNIRFMVKDEQQKLNQIIGEESLLVRKSQKRL